MHRIDLNTLAARESEQVEWKENVADVSDVVRTIVAFANDYANLGGGYVVCGAAESRDEHGFQKMLRPGLTAARLKEVEGKVMSECRAKVDPPIVPLTDEQPAPDPERRILIFVIPRSGSAHTYRATGKDASTYYVRAGRDTVEARNGLLRELLVRKQVLEPWDRRANPEASVDDIDLLILREYLQRMGLWDRSKSVDDYLSPRARLHAMVPPLTAEEPLTGALRPRNFALLLFGREPERFFDGAFALLSRYPGPDRSEPTAERHEVTGDLVAQTARLLDLLRPETQTLFDKDAPTPNLTKYPAKAIQEAAVNALVHRDYERREPVRITVFNDRIELLSPGALPSAVDHAAFLAGRSSPFWRNQTLAFFFNKLQLAQAEGQGIPTIQRVVREQGAPPPEFHLGEASVTCVLAATPRALLHAALETMRSTLEELRSIAETLKSEYAHLDPTERLDQISLLDGDLTRRIRTLLSISQHDTSFTDEDRRLIQSTLDEIRAQLGSLTGSRDD